MKFLIQTQPNKQSTEEPWFSTKKKIAITFCNIQRAQNPAFAGNKIIPKGPKSQFSLEPPQLNSTQFKRMPAYFKVALLNQPKQLIKAKEEEEEKRNIKALIQ